ncbi:MAG: TolC family protein [Candidatus Abyssubacteria bacterium]
MTFRVKLTAYMCAATLMVFWCGGVARSQEMSAEPGAVASPIEERVVKLSLQEAVARALEANLDIKVERYNPDIRDAELLSAEGEFDPIIRLEYSYSDEEIPQTVREGLASDAAETETIRKDLALTFEGKIPTGTEYQLFFDREQSQFTQKDTVIDPDPLVVGDEFIGDERNPSEYNLDLVFSLTQPLLKDFGFDANLAGVRVARGERRMSMEDFRLRVMNTIAEVQTSYWGLVLAIENLRVAESSLQVAQDLLEENRIRLQVGVMAPLEVLQAETGVAQREEEVIVARSLIKDAEDNLKRLLNLPKDSEDWRIRIEPVDAPVIVEREADLRSEIELAFRNRPDYKRSLMQIETDEINERFAENQLLPSLDLIGEYEFRAVNSTVHEAYDDIERGTSPSWLLGATAEYPIGNRTAKGEYQRAQLVRMQSEKESENLRLSIIVEVNRAVRGLETSLKVIEIARKATQLAQESLDAERKKLEVGVSTSHDVLEFEEELADAKRREIVAKIAYENSLINLAVATGTILEKNNIVVDEAF